MLETFTARIMTPLWDSFWDSFTKFTSFLASRDFSSTGTLLRRNEERLAYDLLRCCPTRSYETLESVAVLMRAKIYLIGSSSCESLFMSKLKLNSCLNEVSNSIIDTCTSFILKFRFSKNYDSRTTSVGYKITALFSDPCTNRSIRFVRAEFM